MSSAATSRSCLRDGRANEVGAGWSTAPFRSNGRRPTSTAARAQVLVESVEFAHRGFRRGLTMAGRMIVARTWARRRPLFDRRAWSAMRRRLRRGSAHDHGARFRSRCSGAGAGRHFKVPAMQRGWRRLSRAEGLKLRGTFGRSLRRPPWWCCASSGRRPRCRAHADAAGSLVAARHPTGSGRSASYGETKLCVSGC